MYLQVTKSRGRQYLAIVHGYRDPVTKKVRHKTIKSLGYLDDLKKQFPDPIAHFRAEADEMNRAAALENEKVTVFFDPKATLPPVGTTMKNIGCAAISKLYHRLGLHTFFNNNSGTFESGANINDIMKMLIYSRILSPVSEKEAYEERGMYFWKGEFSLDDVYRCFSEVVRLKDPLQKHLHQRMKDEFGRTSGLAFYNAIKHYFEIDEPDEPMRMGMPRKHNPDSMVRMGLLMDTKGIPIMFDLYPGAPNGRKTLSSILDNIEKEYEIERVIEWRKAEKEIIRVCRRFWRFDEAFKVTRIDLETRPDYLSDNDYLQAHCLVWFVALVLMRLLAVVLGNRFSVSKITESLGKASGGLLGENWYVFSHADEITEAITETLGLNLDRKYLKLEDMESMINGTNGPPTGQIPEAKQRN